MNGTDPDFAQTAADFKKGGWIVAILSALGVYARMLFSRSKFPFLVWIKHGIAGGIVGVIMYFALHGVQMDELYKSVLMCCGGALTPNLFDLIEQKIKQKFL